MAGKPGHSTVTRSRWAGPLSRKADRFTPPALAAVSDRSVARLFWFWRRRSGTLRAEKDQSLVAARSVSFVMHTPAVCQGVLLQ